MLHQQQIFRKTAQSGFGEQESQDQDTSTQAESEPVVDQVDVHLNASDATVKMNEDPGDAGSYGYVPFKIPTREPQPEKPQQDIDPLVAANNVL